MKQHPQHDNLLLFDLFDRDDAVVHFSTTRLGGVSNGTFSSFNMGNYSDDDPLKIRENHLILARMFYCEIDRFIIPHQTHGSRVLVVERGFQEMDHAEVIDKLYGVDATITRERGIFLCVTTGDCVPIILYDRVRRVIAAIHAGWRGTVDRIVEKSIAAMQQHYGTSPADLIAGIGPAISIDHYAVGDEVVARFQQCGFDLTDERTICSWSRRGRAHLDLKEINRRELLRLGVSARNIEKSELCTFSKEELFFSARRQSEHSGRMLTGIMMK